MASRGQLKAIKFLELVNKEFSPNFAKYDLDGNGERALPPARVCVCARALGPRTGACELHPRTARLLRQ